MSYTAIANNGDKIVVDEDALMILDKNQNQKYKYEVRLHKKEKEYLDKVDSIINETMFNIEQEVKRLNYDISDLSKQIVKNRKTIKQLDKATVGLLLASALIPIIPTIAGAALVTAPIGIYLGIKDLHERRTNNAHTSLLEVLRRKKYTLDNIHTELGITKKVRLFENKKLERIKNLSKHSNNEIRTINYWATKAIDSSKSVSPLKPYEPKHLALKPKRK